MRTIYGKRIAFALLFALALTGRIERADAKGAETAKQAETLLSKSYSADGPGATAIIVKDGKIVFRGAYGRANVELGVPMEPDMVFRLGSITKQFTGAAIMLLEERGKLSVKDPITKYLPDYPVHGHVITIEHLLTHTSGIHSYTSIPGYMGDPVKRDLTTAQLIDVFKGQPMDFAPGERWRYSNSGYVLAGAIIEKASGQSYADFITKNIFEPLGMNDSHYGGPQIIKKRVAGYQVARGDTRNAAHVSMTQPHAAGSLLSTVDDLVKWDEALYADKLLSRASYEKMTTPYVLNDGTATTYGYGFVISDVRGHPCIRHGGGIHGFQTTAIRIPEKGIYVAVLSNAAGNVPGPGILATKLAAIALNEPYREFEAARVDPEVLKKTIGVYKISATEQRIVTFEDGTLYTQRTGSGRMAAIPASETTFFYENRMTWFEIERDEDGNAVAMVMHQGGAKEGERAQRVSDKPPVRKTAKVDPATYDDYAGVYELQPGFTLTITREGDRLFGQATGQQRVELFPESKDRFFLKVVDAKLSFVRGKDGAVKQVILHQGGRDVPGRRVK